MLPFSDLGSTLPSTSGSSLVAATNQIRLDIVQELCEARTQNVALLPGSCHQPGQMCHRSGIMPHTLMALGTFLAAATSQVGHRGVPATLILV